MSVHFEPTTAENFILTGCFCVIKVRYSTRESKDFLTVVLQMGWYLAGLILRPQNRRTDALRKKTPKTKQTKNQPHSVFHLQN